MKKAVKVIIKVVVIILAAAVIARGVMALMAAIQPVPKKKYIPIYGDEKIPAE